MNEVPNLDYIREIAGGNDAFEKKFLTIIKTEFPEEKKEYLQLLATGHLEESANIVHKIKHKLGILGLGKAYELAIRYEEELNKGNSDLKGDFALVLGSVEEFIKKMK